MIKYLLQRLIVKNKALFFEEMGKINGFLALFFKQRNTNGKWTKEERAELKGHLKHLSMYLPLIIIFSLPGGSLLLPILAEVLDRRKTRRAAPVKQPDT